MVLRNTQTDSDVYYLQDDHSSHDCQPPGNHYSDQLIEQLVGIAFDPSRSQCISLSIFKDGIHGARCEDARQKGSQSTPRAVHAERIERVVIAEHRLYLGHHEETAN